MASLKAGLRLDFVDFVAAETRFSWLNRTAITTKAQQKEGARNS